MQLQQPVKREPYRPPPRTPEELEADANARLADELREAKADSDGDKGANAPEPELPAAALADTNAMAIEVDASVSIENPSPVDAAPSVAETESPPEPLADGFGAGVAESLPSMLPANDTPSPPA
jgi:hypothetical protein